MYNVYCFNFQSPSDKLYGITIKSDDTGFAVVLGQFSDGVYRGDSGILLGKPRATLTFVPGTYAKIKNGELADSKLSYSPVLVGGETLPATLD